MFPSYEDVFDGMPQQSPEEEGRFKTAYLLGLFTGLTELAENNPSLSRQELIKRMRAIADMAGTMQ